MKKEPKQDYGGVHLNHCYKGEYEDSCKYGEDNCPAKSLREPYWDLLDKKAGQNNTIDLDAYANGVQDGVKWQQEQDKNKYSEEDIINSLHSVEVKDNKNYSKIYEGMREWFEQIKKK